MTSVFMVYNLIDNIARANQRTRILAVIVKLQVCLIKGLQMNQQCDDSNITVTENQRGTRVVVENHSQCKRQSCAAPFFGYGHHDRRFKERLGSSVPVDQRERQMVTRITPTRRLLQGEGSLSDTEIVSQGQMSHVHLSAVRQQDGYRIVIRNFISKKNAYNITSPLHSDPKQNLNKACEKKKDWRLDRKEGRKVGEEYGKFCVPLEKSWLRL